MRILKWTVAVLLVLTLLASGIAMVWIAPRAARLALRVACPTVFVEGRSLDYATDKLKNLGLLPVDITRLVSLRTDEAERSMTARAFGILSYRASYSPGEGCVLQD